MHATLSKNAIYWAAGIAATAIVAVSTTLFVWLPINWPGAQAPLAVSPAAEPAAMPSPTLAPAAAPANGPTAASEPTPNTPVVQRPAFDVVRVEPTGDAVIAGHAAPKAAIELRSDGRVVAQASADASGDFTMLPPPFSAGGHRLELATRTGEAAAVLSDPVAIDVPAPAVKASNSTAPAAPRADAFAIPSAGEASTPGSEFKPDAASARATAPGSVHPTNAARVLMRTVPATETGLHKSLSTAVRSPEAMPEPMPDGEAEPARGGGHR